MKGGAERLTSAEKKKELAGLRRRNKQLEMENDILKRAATYFAGERTPKVIYSLVRQLAADGIPVAVTCRVLKVSKSGYYGWLGRPESPRQLRDNELLKMIRVIHAESCGSYGSPRVHPELTLGLGEKINHKRVARLMRQAGLQGVYRRKCRCNLVNAPTEEDLVQRRFDVAAPDRLWLTDITEHPTNEGNCIVPPSWTPIRGASSAGRSTPGKTATWSSTHWRWRSPAAIRLIVPRSCIPTTGRNTLPGPSGSDSATPACSAHWAQSVIAMTTP